MKTGAFHLVRESYGLVLPVTTAVCAADISGACTRTTPGYSSTSRQFSRESEKPRPVSSARSCLATSTTGVNRDARSLTLLATSDMAVVRNCPACECAFIRFLSFTSEHTRGAYYSCHCGHLWGVGKRVPHLTHHVTPLPQEARRLAQRMSRGRGFVARFDSETMHG